MEKTKGLTRGYQVQDEQALVQRAQHKDAEAFGQLYEHYFDRIYRYVALKIRDQTEAEDMTQQVFIKAYNSVPLFQWRGLPFSAWLYRIAHNQIVDYLRKKTKQPTVPLEPAITAGSSNPALTTEKKLDMERLFLAAKQLTIAQQEVISLRFTSDLPIAEVARIMGKSEGAVKALQHSAIVSLRKIMADEYENQEI